MSSGLVHMARYLCDVPDDTDKRARELWQSIIYLDEHAQELAKVWRMRTGNKSDPDLRMLLLWAAEEIRDLSRVETDLRRLKASKDPSRKFVNDDPTDPDGQVQVRTTTDQRGAVPHEGEKGLGGGDKSDGDRDGGRD